MTRFQRTPLSPLLAFALAVFAFLAPLTLSAGVAHAASARAATVPPAEGKQFIEQLSSRAFAVLQDSSLSKQARADKFKSLLRQGFDLKLIGAGVLGVHRRTATPQQLSQFYEVFPDYIVAIYANRLTDYGESGLSVIDVVPAQQGDVTVRTKVTGPQVAQPIRADWRVRNVRGHGLRIIDLYIEGVSMALTQRDEFTAKIQQKGMEGLIADLKASKS